MELLGAGGAITFAVLELYEKTYRPRIEEGSTSTTRILAVESARVLGKIKLPMEPRTLQSAVDTLARYNELWRRPESLLRWRQYQVGLLVIVAIFAVSAYVQPDYLLANVPLSTWSVVALMILVAANGVFLWFCMELDRFIHKLNSKDFSKDRTA